MNLRSAWVENVRRCKTNKQQIENNQKRRYIN